MSILVRDDRDTRARSIRSVVGRDGTGHAGGAVRPVGVGWTTNDGASEVVAPPKTDSNRSRSVASFCRTAFRARKPRSWAGCMNGRSLH
ncbi:hypothetical protein NJ7G_2816 [Natrinema sp. J7-2]|nr:hypothetical protein NJ7G_2816 [Natrinema sp. J7-2]